MKVIELLEDESRKEISKPLLEGDENSKLQRRTFRNFILHPSALGKDLFTTIKFGLVQYVNSSYLISNSPHPQRHLAVLLKPSSLLADDFEGCMCIISTYTGALWHVW